MRISFCTTCRCRLNDLQRTLPHNLDRISENEEIVLLDYNSLDGLRQWVLGNFTRELGAGRLRLFSERTAPRFFMSHAKNVAHLLGQGEVLVNVDADNYLDSDYLATVRTTDYAKHHMLYPRAGTGGFKGRTAIRRDTFRLLGGYDEQMNTGYGYEEIDLYLRLRAKRFGYRDVRITPGTWIETTNEQKASGQLNPRERVSLTNGRHKNMSKHNLRHGILVANAAQPWGEAAVVDHERLTHLVGRSGDEEQEMVFATLPALSI